MMDNYPPTGPMPVDGPQVVPAATVIVFRRCSQDGPPELLMVQRAREMRFAGGAAVFPGGRIDPEDRDLAARLQPREDPEVAAARIAAVRETLEETGLMIAVRESVSAADAADARHLIAATGTLSSVLDRFGWTLDPDRLLLFAHWCPPRDRAFDTRFFVTDLGTGAVDVAVDATENTRLFWSSARHALAMADSGDISVIFPTRRNLERLALFDSFEDARAQIERHPVQRICGQPVEHRGETWLMIPEGHGYPVLGQPLATAQRG